MPWSRSQWEIFKASSRECLKTLLLPAPFTAEIHMKCMEGNKESPPPLMWGSGRSLRLHTEDDHGPAPSTASAGAQTGVAAQVASRNHDDLIKGFLA